MAKVQVENINTPGIVTNVDADKYHATRDAILKTLTKSAPGNTYAELKTAASPLLPEALFPEGKTSGWWCKCVQLDLEAKGIVKRSNTKPLRFYLA